jgi:heptosyltransferase-3
MAGDIHKILIVKLRYIGDVLLTTPVLKNLRLSYPNARLDILVNEGTDEVLKHNRDISTIIYIERGSLIRQLGFVQKLRGHQYDLVVDLTDSDRSAILSLLTGAPVRVGYNSEDRWRGKCYTQVVPADRNGMHTVDYQLEALRLLGIPVKSSELVLPLSKEDESSADRIVNEYKLNDGRPIVLIHPGARWWFKSWPPEYFAKLADAIQQNFECHVIFAGGASDEDTINKIQNLMAIKTISFAGKITVLQLAALVKRCRLFIGNDNGIMHVASAIGIPVIAFFGLTNPLQWGPRGSGHAIFYKGIDCRPCFPDGCIRGDQSCMRIITVEEVMKAVIKILNNRTVHA